MCPSGELLLDVGSGWNFHGLRFDGWTMLVDRQLATSSSCGYQPVRFASVLRDPGSDEKPPKGYWFDPEEIRVLLFVPPSRSGALRLELANFAASKPPAVEIEGVGANAPTDLATGESRAVRTVMLSGEEVGNGRLAVVLKAHDKTRGVGLSRFQWLSAAEPAAPVVAPLEKRPKRCLLEGDGIEAWGDDSGRVFFFEGASKSWMGPLVIDREEVRLAGAWRSQGDWANALGSARCYEAPVSVPKRAGTLRLTLFADRPLACLSLTGSFDCGESIRLSLGTGTALEDSNWRIWWPFAKGFGKMPVNRTQPLTCDTCVLYYGDVPWVLMRRADPLVHWAIGLLISPESERWFRFEDEINWNLFWRSSVRLHEGQLHFETEPLAGSAEGDPPWLFIAATQGSPWAMARAYAGLSGLKAQATPLAWSPYWSAWRDYKGDAWTAQTNLDQVPEMKQLGYDTIEITSRWFEHFGDLDAREGKFPQGLLAHVRELDERGIKSYLWFCPAWAASDGQLARQHPEWLDRRRETLFESWVLGGQLCHPLDYAEPGPAEYLASALEPLIENGLIGLKLDLGWGGMQPLEMFSSIRRLADRVRPGFFIETWGDCYPLFVWSYFGQSRVGDNFNSEDLLARGSVMKLFAPALALNTDYLEVSQDFVGTPLSERQTEVFRSRCFVHAFLGVPATGITLPRLAADPARGCERAALRDSLLMFHLLAPVLRSGNCEPFQDAPLGPPHRVEFERWRVRGEGQSLYLFYNSLDDEQQIRWAPLEQDLRPRLELVMGESPSEDGASAWVSRIPPHCARIYLVQ